MAGLKPATSPLAGACSVQLSYIGKIFYRHDPTLTISYSPCLLLLSAVFTFQDAPVENEDCLQPAATDTTDLPV